MADLLEKVRWLRTHDDQARAIGQSGQAFALSLDYEDELNGAHRTIRAGFRRFEGKPETEFRFGTGRADNAVLAEGWAAPEADQVWALDGHSRITMPCPVTGGDFVLSLDLAPHVHETAASAQEVSIVVNGAVLKSTSLSRPDLVSCPVPAAAFRQQKCLSILLLHPDGFAPCTCMPIGDERVRSVAIRSLTLEHQ